MREKWALVGLLACLGPLTTSLGLAQGLKLRAQFKDKSSYCPHFALSGDGRLLAVATEDRGGIWVWDVAGSKEKGKVRATLPGHPGNVDARAGVYALALSGDGNLLASAGLHDGTVKLWDVAAGKLKAASKADGLVAVSDDGKLAAWATQDDTITVWDVAAGKVRASLKGRPEGVDAMKFSWDGKLLASGGTHIIRVWDVNTGKPKASMKDKVEVMSLAFSGDDKLLAVKVAGDKTIRRWDVTTGKQKAALKGHTEWVRDVACSKEGGLLASAGGYDETIRLWDVTTGKLLATQREGYMVASVALSRDGKLLVTLGAKRPKPRIEMPLPGEVEPKDPGPRGGHRLKLWDVTPAK
jgi:WD40 repeat protein